jgi:4-diphosphocytidyl-2-C-methyl-D-erythritol kinase
LIRRAHAKINLHLDVGARRADGFHSLRTVFQEISFHDTLRLARTKKAIAFSCSDKKLSGRDNLIVKALTLLRAELNTAAGARAHLTKRIPVGAGLGGGSSDAAAALMAGLELWAPLELLRDKRKSAALLFPLAKRLGADVPFFLFGGTAKASGIGDALTPLPTQPKRWLVLIYPRVHVSTPAAYKLLDEFRDRASTTRTPRGSFFNSFESAIFPAFPTVAAAHAALRAAGCSGVMMSGSGSSVFGFVKNESQGRKIRRALAQNSWDVFLAHTL